MTSKKCYCHSTSYLKSKEYSYNRLTFVLKILANFRVIFYQRTFNIY